MTNKATWLVVGSGLLALLAPSVGCRRLDSELEETLEYAKRVYLQVLEDDLISKGVYPHVGDPESEEWTCSDPQWWTSGFFPGVLWMLYRLTLDRSWAQAAMDAQEGIRFRENDTGTHDVGFVIMSTYGLGLRSGFRNEELLGWKKTVVQAAHSLTTRFNQNAGVMRFWNGGNEGEMLVIVDNMMNLDLLFQATQYSANDTFKDVAKSHALGFSDESMWARGQAWALLGYAETYEWTKDGRFLDAAVGIANIFLDKLPWDSVPFWDFDAVLEPGYHPRDTSAATVAALGILKLYLATGYDYYLVRSEDIIHSVMTYYSGKDWPVPAISINGTVFFNEGNYNTAIIYGDFYLLKYMEQYFKLV